MHLNSTTTSAYRNFAEPELARQDNADQSTHARRRDRRAIDTNPSDKNSVSNNSEPDKNIGTGQKVTAPVDVGSNPSIDPATAELSQSFKTVSEEASIFLKNKFAEMAAKATTPAEKEMWNIDPDNTYLVTFDYNKKGDAPYPAKIVQRISLTQALITNAQDAPKGKGFLVPYYAGGPEVIVKPSIEAQKPQSSDFSSRFNPYREKADVTHTYQGIYIESPELPAPVYNGGNQSPITPAEFKKLIWKADFKKPYDKFLDNFWSSHKEQYPTLTKASFAKSAMAQHQEGSLSAEARELAARAAGLPDNKMSWPDITYEQLKKDPPKDPNIEAGLLKLGSYPSTDLMYITDTKVKLDANGKKVPPLTLLYIPGNSSPIHTFSSQAEMKKWLAEQMTDPVKRAALAAHFPLKDKPNGFLSPGLDKTLEKLGTWPKGLYTHSGLKTEEYRRYGDLGNPQTTITTEPFKLPFDEIAKRQKDRSYADADTKITTDLDVSKRHVLEGFDKVAKAALFLAPLALVMPEVEIALSAYYLATGIITAGIGVDDEIRGKPGGIKRIVFGVLNAALIVAPHILKGGSAGEAAVNDIKPPETIPEESPMPDSGEPTPSEPAPENEVDPNVNRPSGIESNDIKDYAVEDGEQLISGATPNANGIYHVKSSSGEDRWLIKVSYDEHTTRVFEIKSNFKLGSDNVEIIDPFTRKTVITVRNVGDETWEAVRGQGGVKKIPEKQTVPNNDKPSTSTSNKPLLNNPNWQSILDSGTYNGKPVYIHYTDKAGLEAITRQQRISDVLRNETRAGSKGGIYVNPPGQQFNGENVENLLFLGNERYVGRGDYMVIFSSDQVPQNLGPITSGSPFIEMKMPKDIILTPSNVLYMGPNKFPDYFG